MEKLEKEELIRAFLKGECSNQELTELRSWLLLPENQEKAESLFKMTWKEISEDELIMDFDKGAALDGIKAKIDEINPPQRRQKRILDRPPYSDQKKGRIPRLVKSMAALVLIILVGYLIIPSNKVPVPEQIVEMTREAPRGFRNTVTLSDGSVATLNSESSIRYAKNFGVNDRVIYLTGEAFFEVVRDETKPFVVISNDLKTTALGTSFNVNAYKGNAEAISLSTGKVKVELTNPTSDAATKAEMILTPGEQALWNESKEQLTKKKFDPETTLSWKSNVIFFKNTDLKSMIDVLEKWYNVEITVNGEANKLKQTGNGTFKNESLENVLNLLGYSMGFEHEINEEKIIINLNKE